MGACDRVVEVFTRGFEAEVYVHIYNNYALVHLAADSYFTWILGLIAIDFLYYWFHRLGHEVNVMWTTHQSHHSSEDFNLTTALRQNAFQSLIGWIFYAPAALFIPPPSLFATKQIVLLYQIWIHTEVIDKLGPLELIFNTPSHHRVHHGRNRMYIDKNYAGVFIIWDKMFGTFEEEKQKVVYGITTPLNTWDIVAAQCGLWVDILARAKSVPGLRNILKVLFYGPGWKQGEPRLGNINDIPEPTPNESKYNAELSFPLKAYILVNALLVFRGLLILTEQHWQMTLSSQVALSITILYSLASFGYIMDRNPYAFNVEMVRIIAMIGTLVYTGWN
jgi:alkylglycerol monooxygenase